MSRVLALDPGFASIGWAVLELGSPPELLALGVVRTKKSSRKQNVLAAADNFRRARDIGRALGSILLDHHVDIVCAESMSFPRSSSVAAKMAMCWGVLAQLCEVLALPLVQASPQQIKRALTGNAAASKDDVAAAVSIRFPNIIGMVAGISGGLHEHAFDAVGAAVACLESDIVRAYMRSARQRSRDTRIHANAWNDPPTEGGTSPNCAGNVCDNPLTKPTEGVPHG